jgi:DNA-binding Lrp family transcriptional regulator
MVTGYVFFNLMPGKKRDFVKKLSDSQAVKEARLVIGMYDALAMIEAESVKELEKIYFNEIDKIAGIMDSRLYIVACPRTRK